MSFKRYVEKNQLGEIKNNQSFSDITTIKTGGLINTLFFPSNIDCLKMALSYINKHHIPFFLIGNGSNVCASDKEYRGIVISLHKMKRFKRIEKNVLKVSSNYPSIKLAYELARLGKGNLEFISGIPGLIGGLIAMNAGAYGYEIKDYLIDITVLDRKGKIKTFRKNQISFSYRKSDIKDKGWIVIQASFLVSHNKDALKRISEWKKRRINTQPLEYPSLGSIFRNGDQVEAWKVIDSLNLRGYRIGGACFSEKHANFIVNFNHARASDIYELVNLAKNEAMTKLDIKLTEEIIFLNFN